MKVLLFFCFVFACCGANARKLSDDEYLLLPPVFHLDNYERCLAQKNGLYCMGTFEITPESEPNKVYDLIKEYSQSKWVFNRTRIHRGYCLSSRCPSDERNNSLRFERCASQWTSARSLRVTLQTLDYCHNREALHLLNAKTLNSDYQFVKYMIYAILIFNFVGTAYDFMTNGNQNRSGCLLLWSVRTNWRRLTANYDDGDPRLSKLSPLQGIRIISFILTLSVHVMIAYAQLYLINPARQEQLLEGTFGVFLSNSTSLVHVYVLFSTFLTTYNLLLFSEKKTLTYKILAFSIIKRIIRITPMYFLVLAYAATWWGEGEGPVWPAIVGSESNVCRTKFKSHMLFFSNLVAPNQTCLMQTWSLAVDMQLNILVTVLVIALAKRRHGAFYLLAKLFVASCVLISIFAFIFDLRPLIQEAYPEKIRKLFRIETPSSIVGASLTRLYITPWSCLPAAFLGQATAYLHMELQAKGFKWDDHKWLAIITNWGLPIIFLWLMTGHYSRYVQSSLFAAAHIGFERFFCCSIMAIILIGLINSNGRLSKFFGWRGWQVMGRVSLAAMLVHWFVIMSIVVQPTYSHSSAQSIFQDIAASFFLTYMAAVPLTILVEIPMQKTLGAVMTKLLLWT